MNSGPGGRPKRKRKKLGTKSIMLGARGLNKNGFRNRLEIRGVGVAQLFYIRNIFYVTLGS